MQSLNDDKSVTIKAADKGATVIVWYHENYLKETRKQLEDKEVYLEVLSDSSVLVRTTFKPLKKLRNVGIYHSTLLIIS